MGLLIEKSCKAELNRVATLFNQLDTVFLKNLRPNVANIGFNQVQQDLTDKKQVL